MAAPVYRFALCDRAGVEIADVTNISFGKKGSYRENRPIVWTFGNVPCEDERIKTVYAAGGGGDDRPYLCSLARTLKVWRTPSTGGDPVLVGNQDVMRVQRDGDENNAKAAVITSDPMWRYMRRPARDGTGNFSKPAFTSPIAGGDVIQQVHANSVVYEGDLPIDGTGSDFDTSVPPAIDMAVLFDTWPKMIGDLINLFTATGRLDVGVKPGDVSTGLAAGMMGQLFAVNKLGTDLSGVHFDYATGDKNIAKISHVDDAQNVCNMLWYYLGKRLDPTHWVGNITPPADSAYFVGYGQDDSALETARLASIDAFGALMDFGIFESAGQNTKEVNSRRILWNALWLEELLLRINPQEMLALTLKTGCEFYPFEHFYLGDTPRLNTGVDVLGIGISGAEFTVHGFDINVDESGTETGVQVITDDAALGG